MTIRLAIIATAGAIAISVVTVAATRDGREQELQQAIDLIESKGDVARAVPLLQEIANSSDKGAAALALLYLGKIQERTDRAQARRTYERIVKEFPDQQPAATQARSRLASLDDGSPVRISGRPLFSTPGDLQFPSLVNDGAAILFSNDVPSLLEVATGTVTKWAGTARQPGDELAFPVLSADHSQIAFTRLTGKKPFQVHLQLLSRTPGTKPRTFFIGTSEIPYFKPVGWGPDGTWLLVEFQRRDQTWFFGLMNVANGHYQLLKSLDWRRQDCCGGWRSALSPDGRYLAYSAFSRNPSSATASTASLDKHVYILAVDGSAETDLTAASGINETPVWTTDGSHVLFLSNRSGDFDLWAVPVSKGKPISSAFVVHRNIGRVVPLGVTSSGAYYYKTSSSGVPLLSIVATGESRTTPPAAAELPADVVGLRPSWSPDGKHLAFLRPKPGAGNVRELVVRTLKTGDERRFSATEGTEIGAYDTPVWFHDSQALLQRVRYPSAPFDASEALFRADLQDGSFAEVTAFGRFRIRGAFQAALANDDATLYTMGPVLREDVVPSEMRNVIVSADLRSGQQKAIFVAGPARNVVAGVSMSPDGRTIAFFTYPGAQSLDLKTPSLHLARVGTDGGGFRELAGPFVAGASTTAKWSKDGRAILFAPGVIGTKGELNAGPILRVDAGTGTTESTGTRVAGLSSFDLSPDGSHMVVEKMSSGLAVEVRALDNVMAALKRK
jgi:Tol biopolymer transport system component